ncbi:recombinase family protein [Alicyclobacillus ferrooxydans]|uniref:Resolvase n=1 Tax=Alicyclobacillus ferrooxydans TaxID=471514 RepID=A0A0P9F292_9BACL|nr:recombinase family protein [Alicyclobacillus ferrooxydans]KPV45484.1 hypothetical protein AN477_00535 [Alicyclobacillus ferrooxydans]
MTVALYCRVSTDEQAQQGFSIENQQERLKAYCASQGWTDYRLYTDDGYSGTNTDRPQLQRMIQHIKQKKIDAVIVYKLDRLGRKQQDIINMLSDVFMANKVIFKSASEPFDTGTPLGQAMIGILAVFAQLERDTIVERTTMGRRVRTSKGMWYGGRIPFGYRWDKERQELQIHPQQASLVRDVFDFYLQGRSYNWIAEWLADRTTDRTIDHARIREFLRRPLYMGYMNNAGKLVKGRHEAIVSKEVWEQVQGEMESRRDGKAPAGTYLLSGLMVCGLCGGSIIHIIRKSKHEKEYVYPLYCCKRQHVRPKERKGQPKCNLGYFNEVKLDDYVVSLLKQAALDPSVVQSQLNTMQESSSESDSLIDEIKFDLNEVEKKLDRWYTAFEEGVLDPRQLKDRIQPLEETKKALTIRLEEVEDSDYRVDKSGEVFDSLNLISTAWDVLELEERQTVLRAAIKKIILHPKGTEAEIIWNV